MIFKVFVKCTFLSVEAIIIAYTHAHIHTRRHTHTHTYMHTHICTYAYAHTHTHTHTLTHTHMYTCRHTHTHACMYTHTHTHTCTNTCTKMLTQTVHVQIIYILLQKQKQYCTKSCVHVRQHISTWPTVPTPLPSPFRCLGPAAGLAGYLLTF